MGAVLQRLSLTYAGVVELLESGKLYCVDREQGRLYDTLRGAGNCEVERCDGGDISSRCDQCDISWQWDWRDL